jgi:predicted nucleic acid-binding protein
MILVDTSVWIDHFHSPEALLVSLLEKEEALTHPFVIGELALGRLKNRSQFLHDLQLLPRMYPALNPEVLDWVERHRLYGKGISWVDAHLLFSCSSDQCEFWTRDKALLAVSRSLGVKTHPSR